MCSDKPKALHLIEEMQCERNGGEEQFILSDIVLIDPMGVVNQTQKSWQLAS